MAYAKIEDQRAASRRHYIANPGYYADRRTAYRIARAEWVSSYKAKRGCAHCGEADPVCLDFHHEDGDLKEGNVATMVRDIRPKAMIEAEMAKCLVLCANCHRKEHARLRGSMPCPRTTRTRGQSLSLAVVAQWQSHSLPN